MDFRPVETTPEAYQRYQQLLLSCFPGSDKFEPAYLSWLYDQNPDGKVVGFDAWEGDQLAAHYVTVPATAHVAGEDVRVLLSLNTATHPDHRGKGLFTKLADATYAAGTEQGFDAVYGVANANSTPGFTRKLQFQLIEPLLAKVGAGGLGVDWQQVRARAAFRRTWTRESLQWRCDSPVNPITARAKGAGMSLRTKGAKGTAAWTEVGEQFDLRTPSRLSSPMRLFLGLLPAGVGGLGGYFDIPQRLRPSPLNLIY
ncbi:MAG: GNAT family N-acetyltransferase, partial [Planctomycetes bacterium]|nr:GNAT family N-acetyltransferase [Planctomycetota bacterium]